MKKKLSIQSSFCIQSCFISQFKLGDANSGFGPMEITVFHEGTDGVKLDSVAIETNLRTVECTIGEKLDDGEFFNTRCY